MKKILIPFLLFWSFHVTAQNFQITFAASGESAVVDKIIVQNLTSDLSVELNGGDIMLLASTVGIEKAHNELSGRIKIYPNPVSDKSLIQILPPVSGNATVTLYDLSGKILAQSRLYLDKSGEVLSIEGLSSGYYIIDLQGNSYRLNDKLVSNEKSSKKVIVKKSGAVTNALWHNNEILERKGIQATVEMGYNEGDRLIFTGLSGTFTTLISDIPSSDKTITFNFVGCTDGGGNHYPVVHIGSAKGESGSEKGTTVQTWMAVNLKTVKFNDETVIPLVTDPTSWLSLTGPGYCWYNYDELSNKDKFGALYNWYAVNTGKLCPSGWRVASHDDWTSLENYLIASGFNYDGTTTGNKIAKALSSPSEWISNTQLGAPGNTDYPEKINATGFSALPGGYRVTMTGAPYYNLGQQGMWWTSTEKSLNSSYAYFRRIQYNTSYIEYYDYGKRMGMAVRCIKNQTP